MASMPASSSPALSGDNELAEGSLPTAIPVSPAAGAACCKQLAMCYRSLERPIKLGLPSPPQPAIEHCDMKGWCLELQPHMRQANLNHGLPSTASLGRLHKLTDQNHIPESKRHAQQCCMCCLTAVSLVQC